MRLYWAAPNISAWAFKLVFTVLYLQIKQVENSSLINLSLSRVITVYISNKIIDLILKGLIKPMTQTGHGPSLGQ